MAPSASPLPDRLIVLYASQTGNAIDAAERVGREAGRGGCPVVDVLSIDRFNSSHLTGERYVVFVVSTMGQGDPPDSMKDFWKYLRRKQLCARWLEGLHYAVFGLGDSSYANYNLPAKMLDKRLSDLGAERIIEKGLGNDQHSSGYEGALDPWLMSLWKSLNQTNLSLLPRISDAIHPSSNILGDAKVEVIYYSAPEDTTISDPKILIERARSMSPALKCHNEGEPQFMLQMVTNQRLTNEKLQYFTSPEGRNDLYSYNQKENRTVLEVLQEFPSVHMPFEWLVLTPPLKKRAFSISSFPLVHPNQIHLTVSIVSWRTPLKRARHGLCSTWLAGLSPHEENIIPCWIHRGSLPPPQPSVPLVLIGPGTGCAPFRAFVEERAAQSASEPTAPVLFFFGCRNQDDDFLYKDFWLNHAQHGRGVLSLEKGGGFFVAFSRGQPQKVYVQDMIREQGCDIRR